MALMECPSCKKQVSDTQKNCFHCGALLHPIKRVEVEKEIVKQENTALKNFDKLKWSERDTLKKEFYDKNYKYVKFKKRQNNLNAIRMHIVFDMFAGVILFTLGRILGATNEILSDSRAEILFVSGAICCIVLFLKAFVAFTVRALLSIGTRRKTLVIEKRFQCWLKKEKGIDYVVKFDSYEKRKKKIFDQINLEIEPY